jgi:hypothetical protein
MNDNAMHTPDNVKKRRETFKLLFILIPKAQKKIPADNFERL